MTRGTTPTHVLTLPFFTDRVAKLRITYKQGDDIVLEKTEGDVKKVGKTLKYTLTQEETLKFVAGTPVYLQVRVLTIDNVSLVSPIKKLAVSDVLNKEVL